MTTNTSNKASTPSVIGSNKAGTTKLKNLFRALLYLPLLLLVSTALLVSTQLGTRFLITTLDKLVPQLDIEYHSGTLNETLNLARFQLTLKDVEVKAHQTQINWQPLCLLNNTLCITTLDSQQLTVNVQHSAKSRPLDTNSSDTMINLGFDISLDNAKLKQVAVSVNQHKFSAEQVNLNGTWQNESIDIDKLNVGSLDIALHTQPKANIKNNKDINLNTSLPRVFVPLSIELAQAKVTQLKFAINQHRETVHDLNIQGAIKQDTIKLNQLSFNDTYLALALKGEIELRDDYPLSFEIDMTPQQITNPLEVASNKQVVEDKKEIVDNEEISEKYLAPLARSRYWQLLANKPIAIKLGQHLSQLTFDASTDATGLAVILNGELNALSPKLDYRGTISQSQIDLSALQPNLGALNIDELHSQGDIDNQEILITGSLEIAEEVTFKNKTPDSGSLIEPKAIRLALTAKHERLRKNLDITSATLSYQQSQALLKGQLNYLEQNDLKQAKWQGQIELTQVTASNIHSLLTRYQLDSSFNSVLQHLQALSESQTAVPQAQQLPSGTLAGQFKTKGKIINQADKSLLWQLAFNDIEIKGELAELPLNLIGDLALNSDLHINSHTLEAELLGARFKAKGKVDKKWQVNAKLVMPELSLWHKALSGQLRASLDINGEQNDPQLVLSSLLTNIQYQDKDQHHSIQNLQAKGYYQPKADHLFALSFKSQGLELSSANTSQNSGPSLKLDSLSSAIKGDIHKQKMGLQTYGDINLKSALYGTLSDTGLWQGELTRFNALSKLGRWQLDKPLDIQWQYQNGTLQLSPTCLVQGQNSLCLKQGKISNSGQGHNGSFIVSGDTDVTSALGLFLPENLKWQGKVSLDSAVNWQNDHKPTAEVNIEFKPGQISLARDENNLLRLDYSAIKAQAKIDESKLAALLTLDRDNATYLHSQLTINLEQGRALKGSVNLASFDLNLLAPFLPRSDKLEGELSTSLNIDGTLESPSISGDLAINKATLSSSLNPTVIENLSLHSQVNGQSADIQARWSMGQGQAEMTGELNWQSGEPELDLTLSGDKLTIYQPPAAVLAVSPRLKLNFSSDKQDVKGNITINSGELSLLQLDSSAVPVSQDVVFVHPRAEEITSKRQAKVSSQLTLNIDDRVTVKGLGLTAALKGELVLEQQAGQPAQIFGDLALINGQYRFFGQSLAVNKGEFRFIGPLEQPNIYIEATREIKSEDLIAGVKITGTPAKPIIELFSSPTKDQAEILSYILTGKGASSQDPSSNSFMLSAALGLSNQFGIGAVSKVTDRATNLVEKLGINQVQLETNDEGRVGISGYIGNDLMVKYAIGVFNPGYEMTVRYFLLSQLYLESVSGTLGQSLDIYYNFEL